METDLFLNLFKYKATEKQKPLENFLTELFAYILKFLISQENKIICDLFGKFDISFKNFSDITIETQSEYWVEEYEHYARPDLKVTIKNTDVYFIECKVESTLNQYDNIDQVQLYEAIKLKAPEMNKGVRTLTKYEVSSKSKKFNPNKHKIFWRQIYELFDDPRYNLKENLLIRNCLTFLKEFNMGKMDALQYSDNGLENYYSLYAFLYENTRSFANKNNYSTIQFEGNADYFGFNITYRNTNVIWIGCYKTAPKDIVVQTYADEEKLALTLKKKIGDLEYQKADFNDSRIFAKLNIEDILKEKTFETQQKIFENWLKKCNVDKVLNISWDIISSN